MSLVSKFRKRKILNTLVLYLGASWAIIEALSFFIERYHWPDVVFSYMVIVIGFGLPSTIINQWLRNDQIEKKNLKTELLLHTVVIIFASYFVYNVNPDQSLQQESSVDVIENSIAVLPFQNLGANSETDFYGDGFADDVITTLSKSSNYMVISRTSSFQFRDTNRSIKTIRQQLKVSTILEGSFRVFEDQIRLNVNLVKTENEENLWSETFTGKVSDIFSLQSEVAKEIARSLQMELIASSEPSDVNVLAYEYYRKGIDIMRQKNISKPILDESVEALKKAIQIDSTFADAYIALAEVYIRHLDWGYKKYEQVANLATMNIEKAKKYDAKDEDIYGLLAGLTHFNYQWETSEKYCSLALATNPNALFPYWIGVRNAMVLENEDRAIAYMKKLIQLDPLTSTNALFLTWIYSRVGEYELAIPLLEAHLEKTPGDNFALWLLGNIFNFKGEYDKAIEIFKSRSVKSRNDNWGLGYAYGRAGNKKEAMRIAETLSKKKESGTFVPSYMIGYIYLGTNDLDKAFYWFEKAYIERLGWVGYMKTNPCFDEVRNDSRYIDLMKRVNLQ